MAIPGIRRRAPCKEDNHDKQAVPGSKAQPWIEGVHEREIEWAHGVRFRDWKPTEFAWQRSSGHLVRVERRSRRSGIGNSYPPMLHIPHDQRVIERDASRRKARGVIEIR